MGREPFTNAQRADEFDEIGREMAKRGEIGLAINAHRLAAEIRNQPDDPIEALFGGILKRATP